jgi:hypothetical protein
MNSEEKFSRAAVDETEWRNRVSEDNNEGEDKKEERGKREKSIGKEYIRGQGKYDDTRQRCVKNIVAEDLSFGASLVFEQRFDVETKHFGKETHRRLREENCEQAQPKRTREERFAEVIGDARAEGVGQRGEEEVERAEEVEHR